MYLANSTDKTMLGRERADPFTHVPAGDSRYGRGSKRNVVPALLRYAVVSCGAPFVMKM
ncbi:MAG: hypothetical protein QOF01_1879 [Thermomicrobiales bacterium]|jgi:hypothetical protein|nr:hypothetical protein [Thermomicrobiales bacterium]